VCKCLDMVYQSMYNFIGCSKKLVEGQTMEKTELYWKLWLKIDVCQGARNGSFGLAQKNSVLYHSHIRLILQKITYSI
jgi:hypothetical protein